MHKYSHWVPGGATHPIWFYLNEGFHMFQVKESRVRESNPGASGGGSCLIPLDQRVSFPTVLPWIDLLDAGEWGAPVTHCGFVNPSRAMEDSVTSLLATVISPMSRRYYLWSDKVGPYFT